MRARERIQARNPGCRRRVDVTPRPIPGSRPPPPDPCVVYAWVVPPEDVDRLQAAPNLVRVVLDRAGERPEAPCLRYFRGGRWRDLCWGRFGLRVRAVAAGLEGLGVVPGDRVAIVSENRPEWAVADLGSLAAGAVVVSVYASLPAEDAAHPIGHSGARVAFVEDAAQAAKLAGVRDRLPELEHVIVLDQGSPEGARTLAELEGANGGEPPAAASLGGWGRRREDPLTLIYTSGTTGLPKGAVLSHGNVLSVLAATLEAFGLDTGVLQTNLSFLPLAHALERLGGHFLPLTLGHTIAYARALDTIADDFRTVRPDFAVAVPRVFEKVHGRIMARAATMPGPRRLLFDWAVKTGLEVSRRLEGGERLSVALAMRRLLADRLVHRRLREALGGQLKLLVSGGAPLAAEIARFFHAAGLQVCEGWGATETSAPATFNTPLAFRFGSVGRPLPGVEVEIASDDELLVRGPNVFAGYWREPELTAEAFDERGFYRTGDIGRIDADGFVWITDRKKELIVTAGGKNIAPQRVETLLKERPLISHAMLWGDRRPYVVALVTFDREALAGHRPDLVGAACSDPRLVAALQAEVDAVNAKLARFEQVRRFAVVEPDFSTAGGELTVTLKLKRRVVAERHRAAIEGLYA